ncbi:hypothetical protein KEJ21_01505 [Candidatus Bathyarchaeota archaeon]|nr:hypothetical protein [Candidatus Bathyarchaeota archaeon]MBS7630708.1 hypothetical protein [Candidatus Bathyarchaeota archaeon]
MSILLNSRPSSIQSAKPPRRRRGDSQRRLAKMSAKINETIRDGLPHD